MEKKLAQRVKELRSHYNMGIKEFGVHCGLSHVAIFHLENGRTTKPQKSSLQRIINVFGTTQEWMLYGIGEMLPNGVKNMEAAEKETEEYWKEEAYVELKNRNILLEKEIERLWQMLSHITNGIAPNYHRALEN